MNDKLPLSTERLTLRRLQHADLDSLFAIYGNEDNARFQFGPAWSLDQVEELITTQSEVFFRAPGVRIVLAVVELASDVLIGAVELTINSVEDRQGELGFSFNLGFGGRGLATEAVNAALGYSFKTLGMHRVFAGVDTRNERSWKLMERIGMRREAHFVHANREEDTWTDDFIYAMLEHEWNSRNAM